MRSFAEDSLQLLGRSIHEECAESYWHRINKLFEPRTSTGKVAIIKPKGKILLAPTKSDKRPLGTFEIRYTTALGDKKFKFFFDHGRKMHCTIDEIIKQIEAPRNLLIEFLRKKNFKFTD